MGSSAMLACVVREAIGQIAAPDVADRIERAALQRAGMESLPADPVALARFVDHDLYDTIADYIGEDVAEAVKRDLEPILANAEGSSGTFNRSSLRPARHDTDPDPPRGSEERATTVKSRVLLADDDPLVLESTARVLREQGFDVVVAKDGYAALELCQSMGPDVVVADLHMPAISGRQLITTLERTMGRDAPPVIIMTGNVFAPNNIAGAAEVLRKPLDIEELTTAIELAAWDHAAGI